MFVNFSNHVSDGWDSSQKKAAMIYGEIYDLPFPNVPCESDEEEIKKMADKYVNKILMLKPDAVMCQGEFTLSYAVIEALKKSNITVLSACSERVTEITADKENTKKISYFKFKRFRKY